MLSLQSGFRQRHGVGEGCDVGPEYNYLSMKKHILQIISVCALLLLLSLGAKGQTAVPSSVKWMTWQEVNQAIKKAKMHGQEPKIVFVDVYTDWCNWCKRMDKDVFEVPYIARFINENYYPIRFNAETKENIVIDGMTFKFMPNNKGGGYHELVYSLLGGQMHFPTLVFMNDEMRIMQRIPSYVNADNFFAIINYLVSEEYGITPWVFYQEDFLEALELERARQKQHKNGVPVKD